MERPVTAPAPQHPHGDAAQPLARRMIDQRRRGSHRIFLGMAAGVGKTYRMLLEGQAEAENGRDVAIGYLEPHGRIETEELARDLEMIPRRRVTYRDTTVEEMDLPAVLARAPGALPDRRTGAHQRGRGRAREALAGRRARSSRPGSTCTRRSTSSTWRASTTRSPS